MRTVEIKAPAKINLHLEVGSIRPDGFHDLLSIFQAVSLYDHLRFCLTDRPGEITIHGDFNCPPPSNLIYKAVQLFRESGSPGNGIEISVEKRIPSEAGLGGGSSDAAATLKALIALLDFDPGDAVILDMAARLGSDVPFFMKSASAAVRGRGEIIEEIGTPRDVEGLVIKGAGEGISTAAAYKAVDEALAAGKLSQGLLTKEDMVNSFLTLPPGEWPFYNSFMETYRNHIKPLEFIYKLLYDSGAVFSGLSGSGSALFGIFPKHGSITEAELSLKERFPFVERINFLNSIPDALVI